MNPNLGLMVSIPIETLESWAEYPTEDTHEYLIAQIKHTIETAKKQALLAPSSEQAGMVRAAEICEDAAKERRRAQLEKITNAG